MEYSIRTYPQFSACGLNCGLCPRYYTSGSSRCPGCAGDGFSKVHPTCGVLSCCQRKGLEYCFLCDEFPCEKYDGADLTDSFITHKNQFLDMEKAKLTGVESYKAELDSKIAILEDLLQKYDDGRRKRFFCLAVNLFDLHDIKTVMEKIASESNLESHIKDKAGTAVRLIEEMATHRNVLLKLRKKPK